MKLLLILLLLVPLCMDAQYQIQLTKDLTGDSGNSAQNAPGAVFKGRYYHTAYSLESGTELFVTDGTEEGSGLFADINTGGDNSIPLGLTVAGDYLYFTAATEELGRELYRTDGTPEGTQLVIDLFPGAASGMPSDFFQQFHVWNGKLFFIGKPSDELQLYVTEGTAAGTLLLKDDLRGNSADLPHPFASTSAGVFFSGFSDGVEVHITDGTTEGTRQVMDLHAGDASSSPRYFTEINDEVWFTANNGAARSLFRSDGTETGTQIAIDLSDADLSIFGSSDQSVLVPLGDRLVFPGDEDGYNIFITNTDGSAPTPLIDKNGPFFSDNSPEWLTQVGDLVFFQYENDAGNELWRTDGTEEGTFMTRDVFPGSRGSVFSDLRPAVFDGQLFYTGRMDRDTVNEELFASDGTAEGTRLISDIYPGFRSSRAQNFTVAGDTMYFNAITEANGREVFMAFIPPLNILVTNITPPTCFGDSTGTITVRVQGGVPPYDNFQSGVDTTLTGVPAGVFNFNVTDTRDNTSSVTVTIETGTILDLVAVEVRGQNTIEGGYIELVVNNGTSPYTFAWADTSLTTNIREDLDFGDYTVTVTDANGCEFTDTYTVDDLTSATLLNAESFRIYPTLTQDQLTVEMANGQRIRSVSCIDLNGRVLATAYGNGRSSLSLATDFIPNANGTYLVSIVTTTGERGIGRIVVAR